MSSKIKFKVAIDVQGLKMSHALLCKLCTFLYIIKLIEWTVNTESFVIWVY